VTQLEFHPGLWQKKTTVLRVPGDVVCMMISLAILSKHYLMTDRQMGRWTQGQRLYCASILLGWRSVATGLWSSNREFKSYSGKSCVTTVCASVTKQYNLVLAKGWWHSVAGKVTAGLTESNGSLPPSGWLIVTCGLSWLPVHRDQLRAQRSVMSIKSLYLYSKNCSCRLQSTAFQQVTNY